MRHQTGKYIPSIGIQIRNMKMVFNIYCTWRRVMFEKLMINMSKRLWTETRQIEAKDSIQNDRRRRN